MRTETAKLEKTLGNRHTLVTSQDIVMSPNRNSLEINTSMDGSGHPRMEGYLFKRTSNAFKTWNRRWFYLNDNQLVYRKRTGDILYESVSNIFLTLQPMIAVLHNYHSRRIKF